jgi:radical SAM protein with 4Fe4S-binding SPASM domain
MCDLRSKRFVEDLSFRTFREILKQVPNFTMRRVTCEGAGEPLLNPDLIDMFAYAKRRGFITHTFTNATLINEDNVVPLLKALDEITISMDGATKETYEKIRRGAKFEEVVGNVKLLDTARKKKGLPTYLEIAFTCNKLNCHEISKMSMLASQLGVDCLELNMLRELSSPSQEHKQIIRELTCSFQNILNHIPKFHGIELRLNYPGPIFPGCSWPFRACFINEYGLVSPCCLIDPEIINFGNISEKPLTKIWNNEDYQKFRQSFIKGEPPEPCAQCQTAIN